MSLMIDDVIDDAGGTSACGTHGTSPASLGASAANSANLAARRARVACSKSVVTSRTVTSARLTPAAGRLSGARQPVRAASQAMHSARPHHRPVPRKPLIHIGLHIGMVVVDSA